MKQDWVEDGRPPNGWTFATLLRYVLSIIDLNDRRYLELYASSDKAVQAALAANEKAVLKAEETQRRVNENQNEFRGQLKDQAATFVTRNEYQQLKDASASHVTRVEHDSFGVRISALEKLSSVSQGAQDRKLEDRGKSQWGIGIVVFGLLSLISLVASVIALFFAK